MSCCKCEEHKWEDPQPVQFRDEQDKGYCQFHAPATSKSLIVVESFNNEIFARIDQARANAKGICNLSGTVFPGDISFSSFNHENQLPEISFADAEFLGMVDFDESAFGGMAIFERTTFLGIADFSRAMFNSIAQFRTTKFVGIAIFMQARFYDRAEFDHATFGAETSFGQAFFSTQANFTRATFMEAADFWSADFPDGALFYRTTFGSEANFQKATFGNEINYSNMRAKVNAVRLHSLTPASLSHIFFSSLETEHLSFKGCEWPEKLGCEEKAYVITESEESPHSTSKISEEIYRSLKQKAAAEHDQPMTSWWHFREKLMKLEGVKIKYPKLWHLHWLGLYWRFCGFGERWVPPLRTLWYMLYVCLLILALGGVRSAEVDGAYTVLECQWWPLQLPSREGVENLGTICLSLLKYLLLIKEESIEFRPIYGWAEFLILLFTRLVIPIQAAFFAIALRNAYRR